MLLPVAMSIMPSSLTRVRFMQRSFMTASLFSFDCLLMTSSTHSCLTSHPVLNFTCSCTVYRGPAWLCWFVPVALAFVNERDTAGVLPDAFLP